MFIFFFQAEDGIRDIGVTGVQTCALPISADARVPRPRLDGTRVRPGRWEFELRVERPGVASEVGEHGVVTVVPATFDIRSEERRGGKEGRSRWSPYH